MDAEDDDPVRYSNPFEVARLVLTLTNIDGETKNSCRHQLLAFNICTELKHSFGNYFLELVSLPFTNFLHPSTHQ